MTCYSPLRGYRSGTPSKSGKFPIVIPPQKEIEPGHGITIPCGACIGCRIERSRAWAIRCMHESTLHPHNQFLTLTYDNINLPKGGSLDKTHFPLFIKRLRQDRARFEKKHDLEPSPLRYFMCGEYGDQDNRPHYHACMFNMYLPDKVRYKRINGNQLYTSRYLEEKWGHGYVTTGELNWKTAAYTARYILKKVTGKQAENAYTMIDQHGQITELEPEYATMSLKPGIASQWYEKFKSDVFPDDFIIQDGRKIRTPRFYDKLLEAHDPELYQIIKDRRLDRAILAKADNTPERLAVREKIKQAQISQLKRTL